MASSLPLLVERGAMANARGMTLGGRGEIFDAVVDHLDRMPAFHGEQSRMRCERGGVIFFAAEGAAGLSLDDANFFCRAD